MQIGFILAAGFGKRMGDLTAGRPKPLLEVAGVPLVYYALFQLYRWGVPACVLNVHYLAEQIENELRDFPWFPLYFSREEPAILGTAGGLRHARPLLTEAARLAAGTAPSGGGPGLVLLNPDTIFLPAPGDRPDPAWLDGALTCFNLLPRPAGNQEAGWDDADETEPDAIDTGRARPVRPASAGRFYYAGYSLIDPTCVADLPDNRYAELGPIWKDLAAADKIRGRRFQGKVVDAGTRAAYDLIKDREIMPPEMLPEWRRFLSKL